MAVSESARVFLFYMASEKLNGYTLTKAWFNFAFNNPEVFNTTDHALYFWVMDCANRNGWKSKFSFAASTAMEVLSISHYNTYKKAFDKLVLHGFISVVRKSPNHHQATIISISQNDIVSDELTNTLTNTLGDVVSDELTATLSDTLYKQQTTNNKLEREKAHPIFEKSNLKREWDIPFMPDFTEKILKHPNGKATLNEIAELWDTWIAVRYKAHNKQFTSDISEAQALKTLIAKCKGSTQVIESIKRMIVVESANPFTVDIETTTEKKPILNHYGFDVSKLG